MEKTKTLPNRIVISDQVLFQELDEEAVLLDLGGERYYSLDDVGVSMWRLLAKDGDVSATLAKLLDAYEVEESTLRNDLAEFINELQEAKLLRVIQ